MAIPAAVYVLFKHEIKNFISMMLACCSLYVIDCGLTLTKGQTSVSNRLLSDSVGAYCVNDYAV